MTHVEHSNLLNQLPRSARQKLLELGVEYKYDKGRHIIRQGETATFVALIQKGYVKVTQVRDDNREGLLAIRSSGDLVGDFGVLWDLPRSATVTAITSTTVRVIGRDAFLRHLQSHKEVSTAVNRTIMQRVTAAHRKRLDLAEYDATTRLARVLVEVLPALDKRSPGAPVRSRVPLSQAELASLGSMKIATAEKALRHLRERGVVRTKRRHFIVLDTAALLRTARLPRRTPYL